MTTVFSIIFVALALLAVLFGFLRGMKRVVQLPLARGMMTLLITVLSVFLAPILTRSLIAPLIASPLTALFGEAAEQQVFHHAMSAVVSMCLSPFLFLLLFGILRPIGFAFVKPLARSLTRREAEESDPNAILRTAHFSPGGAIVGGVSGLLLFCVLCVPFVGTGRVIKAVGGDLLRAAASLPDAPAAAQATADAIDALGSNAGAITVNGIGGGLLYDALTAYPTGSGTATLYREAKLIGSVGVLALAAEDGLEAEAIQALADDFESARLIPELSSELLRAASTRWQDGKEFLGMTAPDLGNEGLNGVFMSTVETFSHATGETVRQDVRTVLEITCILIENGTAAQAKENPAALLAKEEENAEILLPLLQNPRLSPLVGALSDLGILMFCEQAGIPVSHEGMYDASSTR